jgi:hypothetical protein
MVKDIHRPVYDLFAGLQRLTQRTCCLTDIGMEYIKAFLTDCLLGGILSLAVQSVKHRFPRQGVFLPA